MINQVVVTGEQFREVNHSGVGIGDAVSGPRSTFLRRTQHRQFSALTQNGIQARCSLNRGCHFKRQRVGGLAPIGIFVRVHYLVRAQSERTRHPFV